MDKGELPPNPYKGSDYRGVAALFNGDLHTIDPSWAPREDWVVVDQDDIRYVPAETISTEALYE